MRFKPHDYQTYCINKLLENDHLGLFLSMGLGKTVITLTALNHLLYHRHVINRILIIAPKRVAESTWTDEALKWDHLKHLRFSKILGNRESRLNALKASADIYIINRENVTWLVDTLGDNWFFDTVVIDELSSFKNFQAKRFKALKKMLPKVKRVYGLTGTPASNGLMDLWSQVYLLDGGKRLGKNITAYRNNFFKATHLGNTGIIKYEPYDFAESVIKRLISDICIGIDSSDYLELPDLVPIYNRINLSPPVKKQYKDLERDYLLELPDTQVIALNAGVVTNKLLQVASGAVYDDNGIPKKIHNEKLSMLDEIIESAGDDNILVFYNYKHEREAILQAHTQAKVLESDKDIVMWNKGRIKLLLAHPASCGYGLNLQNGGHRIVWYSPTWNLEQYQQANARLFRQGQKNTVTINHIIAKGTMDEIVLKALESKDKCQKTLLEGLQAKKEEIKRGN